MTCEHRWILTVRRVAQQRFEIAEIAEITAEGDWRGSMIGGSKILAKRQTLQCQACGATRTARWRIK